MFHNIPQQLLTPSSLWYSHVFARTGWATPARRAPLLSTTSWWGWAKWVGFLNEGVIISYHTCSSKTCLCFFQEGNLRISKQQNPKHQVTSMWPVDQLANLRLGMYPLPGWEAPWCRDSHPVTFRFRVGSPRFLVWSECFAVLLGRIHFRVRGHSDDNFR